jgi:HTH-type transcriptional regulator/antitoxin HigA
MAMEIGPIRNEADYEAALADIEQYFDCEPKRGTLESDRFDVLAVLIGAYEDAHHAIASPDLLTALTEVMALRGYRQVDLGVLLGSKSRASEIMHGKRWPSLAQARKLHEAWGVPAVCLLGAVESAPAGTTLRGARAEPTDVMTDRTFKSGKKLRASELRLIALVIREVPSGRTAGQIRTVLQSEGMSLSVTAIRRALNQLTARREVAASADGKIWRYIGGPNRRS